MKRIPLFLITIFLLFSFPAAGEEFEIQSEEDVVPYFIGHWRFEYGERTGGRIYTPLFGNHSAEIQEYFDNAEFLAKGLLQYSSRDQMFSSSLFFNVGENGFSLGRFDAEAQTITYQSLKPGNEGNESVLHFIGPDHFEITNYRMEEGERKAVFNAQFKRVK